MLLAHPLPRAPARQHRALPADCCTRARYVQRALGGYRHRHQPSGTITELPPASRQRVR